MMTDHHIRSAYGKREMHYQTHCVSIMKHTCAEGFRDGALAF